MLVVPSPPFIILRFVIIHPAYIFFVKEKTVVISFPVNKALRTPVIISSIRVMAHGKTGRRSDDKGNIRTGIRSGGVRISPAWAATADDNSYNGNQCN
jgi:hypothetical protein